MINDMGNGIQPTCTRRRHFFLIELKTLFISHFTYAMDVIFYCIGYAYVVYAYRGNMNQARRNPDAIDMLTKRF